uniref:Uncharacterized protein n=1 Tax=Anguilla anguilla TaxID=7936 RepID=A0A0E9UUR0_ANGAN
MGTSVQFRNSWPITEWELQRSSLAGPYISSPGVSLLFKNEAELILGS